MRRWRPGERLIESCESAIDEMSMTNLRIGADRIRLYGGGLFLVGLTQLRFVKSVGHFWDWLDFYIAGSLAGSRALLDPPARDAWGAAHHLPVTAFAYVPAFAWVFVPTSHMSVASGFVVNAVVMLAICGAASLVATRIYGLTPSLSLLMILAWAPTTGAIVTGQNSPLGLLLSLLAILGLVRDQAVLAGVAIGALCYKPTYGIPFLLLLLVFRKWKVLGVAAACGVAWYALSATAAGGDWLWPEAYLRSLKAYVGPDFAYNAPKAVSIPGLLLRLGTPDSIAFALGLLLLIAATFMMRRFSLLRAASVAGLIGVATSPHAWAYDAAVGLPALFWVVKEMPEPRRTNFVVAAYVIAPLWLASNVLRVDLLAIVVIGLALICLRDAQSNAGDQFAT
jgi:Glycosyltransferase family 87